MTYKNRFELKYIISYQSYKHILHDLRPFVKIDKHGDKDGTYKVCSTYYDSPNHEFFLQKINGNSARIKLRVRHYENIKENKEKISFVNIEIKGRQRDIIKKTKIRMLPKEANEFIKNPIITPDMVSRFDEKERNTLEEISYLKKYYNLVPVLDVEYLRQAFVGKYAPNVRITFDKNIKCKHLRSISSRNIFKPNIIPVKYFIMEIKHCGIIPSWIIEIIEKHNLYRITFSKYCTGIIKNKGDLNSMVY